eukprot:TRINITY_DN105866_c0_g1_i1.p1 TRINITY_DN105866_c0_g1~~TRINITY_DN105866_c0_g1_i1.p1  ORF type:complete len:1110 (-),score=271.80 TRINITY_DN105866_c0_g1_i1:163-3492(-)
MPTPVMEEVPSGRRKPITFEGSDGTIMDVDSLNLPQNVKAILEHLDFESDGHMTTENLAHSAQVIEAMKKGIDADGSGHVSRDEMMKGVELLTKIKQQAASNSGELDYTYLPEKVQDVMKEWDVDGSGKVSHHELAAAAQAHQKVKEEGRLMKKIIFVMAMVILLLMVSMFVLSYLAVDMAKEMRGDGEGTMKNGAGDVVKVGSSDYIMENGKLVPRGDASTNETRRLTGTDGVDQPVTMSTAQTTFTLSSRLSNKQLSELNKLQLELNAQDSRDVQIQAWKRVPQPGAHFCGSVVVLTTPVGNFTLDDEDLYYKGDDQEILERYGATDEELTAAWKDDEDDLEKTRRLAESNGRRPLRRLSEAARKGHIQGRRLSAAALAGMYNSIANAAEEFECVITADDGTEIVIEPPKPPVFPYSYVTEYDHECEIKGKPVCEAKQEGLIGMLRPGAVKHADGSMTMKSYQQVLMLANITVTVDYYPSHFMQRKVTVYDYIKKKRRSYSLFGLVPNSGEKLHCDVQNMSKEEASAKAARDVDLAYLGLTDDGNNKNYMRWSISEKGAVERPGEPKAAMELWVDRETKAPYRMFWPGPFEIAKNVKVTTFFSPMRMQDYKQGLNETEVAMWLNSTIGLDSKTGGAQAAIQNLIGNCEEVKELKVDASGPALKIPDPAGYYNDEVAHWYGDRLMALDNKKLDRWIDEKPRGVPFAWPESFGKFWRKMKEVRKQLKIEKDRQQASAQCSGSTSSQERRLQNQVFDIDTIVVPTFITDNLIGDGSVIEFGFDPGAQCLVGRVKLSRDKPPWAEAAGVDIDVQMSMQLCWNPLRIDGEFFIQVTKGGCLSLPYVVPKYNMWAAYIAGFLRLRGSSAVTNGCSVTRHGKLEGVVEIDALIGIYNDDDSWRPCACEVCDPGNWPNYGEDKKALCGCERFTGGDRRRGVEHDYDSDPKTWKWGFDENKADSRRRRRRRRGGADCAGCYQNPPAFDIGAQITPQFVLRFDQFTPGFGVDVSGSVNVQANINILGFQFNKALVEDTVLFSKSNAFEIPGPICRRRLGESGENTTEEPALPTKWRCVNTCSHANDGHCDDGGAGSDYSLCDLGTDCNDCGTRAITY